MSGRFDEPIGADSARARVGRVAFLVRLTLVAILSVIGTTLPATARVAKLKFTKIGQINGTPAGSFAGFTSGEFVDMTFEIEETTPDSDATPGAGTYNDPNSVTTFIGQTSLATVSFVGFGFQLLNPTRLDPGGAYIVPASGPNPSGQYIRDWDVFDFDPPISNVDDLFTVLAELPHVTIGNVPADGFAIRSPDVAGNTTDFMHLIPTITLEVGCGNGVLDPNEVCDSTCCDSTCDGFAAGGTTCRPVAGPCDVAETCPGGSDVCPPDGFATSGVCRAAQDNCDLAESCDGSGAACPMDAFVSGGTECRPALGPCDETESCTGTDPFCPPDTHSVFTCGTICRPSMDACDAPEFCESFAATGNYDCPGEVTLCTPTPTNTPTSTPTGSPMATATETSTTTQSPTPSPTPLPTSLTIQRAFLSLDRSDTRDNGSMRLKLLLDDPSDTLAADLLNGDVRVEVTDVDSSWNVVQLITAGVQRARDIICRPSPVERAVFKRSRKSPTLWMMRTYARGLSDTETGSPQPGINPIGVPIEVRVLQASQSASAQTAACRSTRNTRLICNP